MSPAPDADHRRLRAEVDASRASRQRPPRHRTSPTRVAPPLDISYTECPTGYSNGRLKQPAHREQLIASPNPRWLLVSDIDDTFIGDEGGLSELLAAVRESGSLAIVLNSSRPRPSVERTLRGCDPPVQPDGIISGMGTEICLRGVPMDSWRERFADWDRDEVDRIMVKLGARPHADEFQTPFKASFAVQPALQAEARQRLSATGIALQVVASGASDFDVLPARAGKGEATLFVAGQLGIDIERNLVVAGDSRNDLAMFEACGRGIVVGNARPELRAAVDPARAFFARETHARGILEGLRHWGALAKEPTAPTQP